MGNRLKTLFFVLVLSMSVFSGTPFQGGDMKMKENVCPMKCCKKSAKSTKPRTAKNPKYLCRVLVCSQNMPSNSATVQQPNLAPVIIASEKVSLFEILSSTLPKDAKQSPVDAVPGRSKFLPKYIRFQRILV